MKPVRTNLRPLCWFVGTTAFLWILTATAPLLDSSIWYPGYPVYRGQDAFTDLTVFTRQMLHFHQADFWTATDFPLTYPAATGVILLVLLSSGHGLAALVTIVLAATVVGLTWTGVALVRRGISIFVAAGLMVYVGATAYPLYFELSRANIEFFNCFFLAVFTILCWRKYWLTGAIFLGLAVACKIYPFILIGLLVAQRKYRAAAVALLSAAIANFAALWVLGPSIGQAQAHISAGLTFFKTEYVVPLNLIGAPFDHSLFGTYKLVAILFFHHSPYFQWSARGYLAIASILATGLYFRRIVLLPLVNQIVILISLAVIIPPVSNDYTLLALYIPLVVLILYSLSPGLSEAIQKSLTASFLCLAWLLSPETYLHYAAGPSKCVALLLLVAVQCRRPLWWPNSSSRDFLKKTLPLKPDTGITEKYSLS